MPTSIANALIGNPTACDANSVKVSSPRFMQRGHYAGRERQGSGVYRLNAQRDQGGACVAAADIVEGPIFRRLTPHGRLTSKALSAQSVALIVKARAAAAGYDPSLFAGHSLRAGFLTEAGRQGANLFKMKEHSRHKSLEMLSEYVRDQEVFRNHAAEGFA